MKFRYLLNGITAYAFIVWMMSCQSAGGNKTGSEYMPDMAHSVAYEANTYGYYYQNRWGSESDLHAMVQPRKPVANTISRSKHEATSSFVPYYYGNTEEERTRAGVELTKNPIPISSKGLEQGKYAYNIQCAICHGEKADGGGYLVRDGGKYPVQPANFMLDEFLTASNGRYYHAIMHGKNLMGAYADKLSYEERWNVIHYIRSLQAASKNLQYDEKANTYDNNATPLLSLAKPSIVETAVESEN